VLQWLAVGVFINSLAYVPFAFLQGAGRPDLTAMVHLIELPLYLGLLWWLVGARGIEGAAIAWNARAVFDALALFVMARRFLPTGSPMSSKTKLLLAAAIAVLILATLPQGLLLKASFLLMAILSFVFVTWFVILTPEERSLAQDYR
jgi:O-antigen/teichoic acid export membrane protein